MQIIHHLRDINSKKDEFCWKRHVSHTSVFMNILFPFHCRGITTENISLGKNSEVQSFVYTMIDIRGAVILYSQLHQNFKTTLVKQTHYSEGDQSSPRSNYSSFGIYVISFVINVEKSSRRKVLRALPGLCQSPRFHSGSERTLPVSESGPW